MSVIITGAGVKPIKGKRASDFAVGESVFLTENGSPVEYLVVNQGIPSNSALYDSSCEGIWLLRKDAYETSAWHSSDTSDYENSTIHSYLNSTFLGLFESSAQSAIKPVKLPYRKGSGDDTTVTSGASGLSAKIFLLSLRETDYAGTGSAEEGACLSYFSGCGTGANSKRVANLSGSPVSWWLRSPFCSSADSGDLVSLMSIDGNGSNDHAINSHGVRPALILPYTARFDEETRIFKGVS